MVRNLLPVFLMQSQGQLSDIDNVPDEVIDHLLDVIQVNLDYIRGEDNGES